MVERNVEWREARQTEHSPQGRCSGGEIEDDHEHENYGQEKRESALSLRSEPGIQLLHAINPLVFNDWCQAPLKAELTEFDAFSQFMSS
jgi:hypothetical protein